jgi:hypothetical protein
MLHNGGGSEKESKWTRTQIEAVFRRYVAARILDCWVAVTVASFALAVLAKTSMQSFLGFLISDSGDFTCIKVAWALEVENMSAICFASVVACASNVNCALASTIFVSWKSRVAVGVSVGIKKSRLARRHN